MSTINGAVLPGAASTDLLIAVPAYAAPTAEPGPARLRRAVYARLMALHIPSPPANGLRFGPLGIHVYGVM